MEKNAVHFHHEFLYWLILLSNFEKEFFLKGKISLWKFKENTTNFVTINIFILKLIDATNPKQNFIFLAKDRFIEICFKQKNEGKKTIIDLFNLKITAAVYQKLQVIVSIQLRFVKILSTNWNHSNQIKFYWQRICRHFMLPNSKFIFFFHKRAKWK